MTQEITVHAPWKANPHLHQEELLDLAFLSITEGHPLYMRDTAVIASRESPDALLVETVDHLDTKLFAILRYKRRHHRLGWHSPRVKTLESVEEAQRVIDEESRVHSRKA